MSRKQQGPCAACKLLRRRCAQDCIFAPYFPADDPNKFANVHKVFGASNVSKMLQELPVHLRSDAVSSIVYEATARVRDPVYGCVGAIASLQHQVDALQMQLAMAQAEAVHLRFRNKAYLALPMVDLQSEAATDYSREPTEQNTKSPFTNMSELMWSW